MSAVERKERGKRKERLVVSGEKYQKFALNLPTFASQKACSDVPTSQMETATSSLPSDAKIADTGRRTSHCGRSEFSGRCKSRPDSLAIPLANKTGAERLGGWREKTK